MRWLLRRYINCRCCIRRDCDPPFEYIVFLSPGTSNHAIHRLEFGGSIGQSTSPLWMHNNMLITGLLRVKIDPAHPSIHPGANGTICIMVEGVHARVLKPLVMCPAIPSFPNRCCPLCDRIEPGRPSRLFQQCVG